MKKRILIPAALLGAAAIAAGVGEVKSLAMCSQLFHAFEAGGFGPVSTAWIEEDGSAFSRGGILGVSWKREGAPDFNGTIRIKARCLPFVVAARAVPEGREAKELFDSVSASEYSIKATPLGIKASSKPATGSGLRFSPLVSAPEAKCTAEKLQTTLSGGAEALSAPLRLDAGASARKIRCVFPSDGGPERYILAEDLRGTMHLRDLFEDGRALPALKYFGYAASRYEFSTDPSGRFQLPVALAQLSGHLVRVPGGRDDFAIGFSFGGRDGGRIEVQGTGDAMEGGDPRRTPGVLKGSYRISLAGPWFRERSSVSRLAEEGLFTRNESGFSSQMEIRWKPSEEAQPKITLNGREAGRGDWIALLTEKIK